jgi:hypothetical protein
VKVTSRRGRVQAQFDGHWIVLYKGRGRVGETRIAIHQVVSVETHSTLWAAMTSGRYVRFVTGASTQRRMFSADSSFGRDARVNDPNTFRFRKRQTEQVLAFRHAVLDAIAARHGASAQR